jgi:D-alanine-D-alanine ligase-like ATP-grasp enzyme
MTRVGVLRGGNTFGYDQSIRSGNLILNQLSGYHVQDIFVDKNGTWHMQGIPVLPHDAAQRVDVVFNALHTFDKDVHHFLDYHSVPHTGSGAIELAVLNNRLLAKRAFVTNNFKTPFHKEILPGTDAFSLFRTFPMPAIVKYFSKSETVVVKTIQELEKVLQTDEPLLIEEYIPGTKVSVHIIEHYRDQPIYVLPPVEVYEDRHIVPSNFSHTIKDALIDFARKAHEFLSLKHYSYSDFIIHPKRGVYLVRVGSLPDISEHSAFAKSLESVGGTVPQFIHHVVELALEGK